MSKDDSDLIQQLIDATAEGPALGQQVTSLFHTAPYNGPHPTLVTASDYGTAGLVAFYTPSHPRVYGQDHQYGLWGGLPSCSTCNVLYVGE